MNHASIYRAMAAAAISALTTSGARAEIIFVKAACDGGLDNGTSWTDAHCGSQGFHDALARAVVGDELWVAQGVYAPAGPGGDRTISFVVPSGVQIYGGFSGDETNRDNRDPATFETVFSGDLNSDDIRDMLPFPTNPWENAYHVFTLNNTNEDTLIDSCTITSGFSSGRNNLLQDRGGNIQILDGSLTVRDCSIRFGYADTLGGGIYVEDGELTVEDCVFQGNSAANGGGGLAVTNDSDTTVSGCVFNENIGGFGCGLYVGDSSFIDPPTESIASVQISDTVFSNGLGLFGSSSGGAIMIFYGDLLATRCDFIDNDVPGAGGAIYSVPNDVRFESCRFFGNNASADGGGVVFASGDDSILPPKPTTMSNCLMVGNNGVSVSVFDGIAEFINCTIAHNTVSVSLLPWPTFVIQHDSGLTIHNSIVWNNDPFGDSLNSDNQFAIVGFLDPILNISNSIIQSWDGSLPGDAQAIDPVFVDPAGPDGLLGTPDDNLRLMTGSPAIGAGDDALIPDDLTDLDLDGDTGEPVPLDLDGNTRVVGAVDLGAYELQDAPCPADFTNDGELDFFDISAFVSAYSSMDPIADFTHDGTFDFFDIAAFIGAYSAGCP